MSRLLGRGAGSEASWELFQEIRLFPPQNDPDKEYNMPKDGTVHELTSNVSAACGRPGWGCPEPPGLDHEVLSPSSRPGLSRRPNPKRETGSFQPPFSLGRPRTCPRMVKGMHCGS